jgi:8-oxo-dGTP pyrophosphatase MutT (NUDIX family)
VPASEIEAILRAREPQRLAGDFFRPAAVLVPVQERPDGDYLVLTQRADHLNHHRGQIAFPGGKIDPADGGPLEAALREAYEEIGIRPGDVRVLGQLDQVTAAANFVITPFVGSVPHPYAFRLNPAEVVEVFSVPVAALLDQGQFSVEPRSFPSGKPGPIYHFRYEGRDIWGATARIVKQFLELVYGFRAD